MAFGSRNMANVPWVDKSSVSAGGSTVTLVAEGTESQVTEDVFSSAIRLLSGRFFMFQVKHWHSTNYVRTTGGAFTLSSRKL